MREDYEKFQLSSWPATWEGEVGDDCVTAGPQEFNELLEFATHPRLQHSQLVILIIWKNNENKGQLNTIKFCILTEGPESIAVNINFNCLLNQE